MHEAWLKENIDDKLTIAPAHVYSRQCTVFSGDTAGTGSAWADSMPANGELIQKVEKWKKKKKEPDFFVILLSLTFGTERKR